MNTIGIVFSAEFVRRFRSRPFLIGTVLGAAVIVLLTSLNPLVTSMMGKQKRIVLAGDPSIVSAARPLLERDFTITGTLPRLTTKPDRAFLQAHDAAAAVLLERGRDGLNVRAFVRDPGSFKNALTDDLRPLGIAIATNLPVERIVDAGVHVDVRDVEGKFADAASAQAAKGIAFLFIMLLYLAVIFNAQSIVASVTEEKTSRIAEVLVAAVDPAQLLTAKVLAAAATGFIQIGVWIASALVSGRAVTSTFQDTSSASASTLGPLAVSAPELLWFLVFFAIGFAQCATLFAAAGSLVSRVEDVGSISAPLYLPIVAAIIIAQLAIAVPNAPSVVALSFVPLLAPFVMFTRIAVSTVPVWQVALALALNVGAAVLFAWIAGRVYRVGLLLYGRPPSWRQVAAAMRAR